MPTTASSSTADTDHRPLGETVEARIAKALAHPLRAQILQRLGEREASPGELADEIGEPLGVVSYHVRMLREYRCIELVRTVPRRGALQHYYRAIARPQLDDDQWRNLPSGLRRELAGATISSLVEDLAHAVDAGTLDEADTRLTRLPLELDARGWKKLNALLARTLEQAQAIAHDSSARADNSDDRFATELAVLHFKRANPRANRVAKG